MYHLYLARLCNPQCLCFILSGQAVCHTIASGSSCPARLCVIPLPLVHPVQPGCVSYHCLWFILSGQAVCHTIASGSSCPARLCVIPLPLVHPVRPGCVSYHCLWFILSGQAVCPAPCPSVVSSVRPSPATLCAPQCLRFTEFREVFCSRFCFTLQKCSSLVHYVDALCWVQRLFASQCYWRGLEAHSGRVVWSTMSKKQLELIL